MSEDSLLIEILKLCLWLQSRSIDIYENLAKNEKDEVAILFWKKMAEDEKIHLMYWGYLISLAEEGKLPSIYKDGEALKNELLLVKDKIEHLIDTQEKNPEFLRGFLIACRLEFSMLNETLTDLFKYVQFSSKELTPQDDFNTHIESFIKSFEKLAHNPEAELLGDVIKRYLAQNKYLLEQSRHDYLTGLFNRRGFYKAIEPLTHLAQRSSFSVGVLIIDIDNFKAVNSEYGHQTGDKMLVFTAESIKKNTRKMDVLARYRGEEFIVYLSSLEKESIEDICQRIQNTIEKESKEIIPIGVSIGACVGNIGANVDADIKRIIEHADICLYSAKEKSSRNINITEVS